MGIENFIEWQQRQGHEVIKTESSYWYKAGPRVFQAFPYDWLITPSEQEIHNLLVHHKIAAIRFSTPVESSPGKMSYHIVKKKPYSLDDVGKKSRQKIRKGLSKCAIEKISLAQLAEEGWKLQLNVLVRQKRTESMDKKEWENVCLAADGIPGFEAWGAYVDGELAAALLTACVDGVAYFLYSLSQEKFFNLHVNYVLFYQVTCTLLEREEIKSAFYTVQSLDAPASIDDFKFRMHLDAVAVRQRVVFHPILKPFANKFSQSLIIIGMKLFSGNHVLSKGEGMLRFYLDGKLPAELQVIPECVNGGDLDDN